MPEEKLQAALKPKMIAVHQVEYGQGTRQQGLAHCECQVCHHTFSRTVGALVSGNRGCPGCLNAQERDARIVLTHNLGGAFAIRQRPRWMHGQELDGWNQEVTVNGRTVAFEYHGKYWHQGDARDRANTHRKMEQCAQHGVLLLVIRAEADRPTWDEQLRACQKAVDEAGLTLTLVLPPAKLRAEIARMVPHAVRARLAAINHEALEYDQDPDHRGRVKSRCLLTGEIVSQAPFTLRKIRGCHHCRTHPSRREERQNNSRRAAQAGWAKHRQGDRRFSHVKLTDEMVAFVRTQQFPSLDRMAGAVAARFGVRISPSGLQYARSGRTHSHLNQQFPPIRKAASRYTRDHPAVQMACQLRLQGLSLDRIAATLFEKGLRTRGGTQFSASQVKMFLRFS